MPRGDGTGPIGGGGPGTGAGRGTAVGRGRNNGPLSAGPGGVCVCPNCETSIPHGVGESCMGMKCPKCGAQMIRG